MIKKSLLGLLAVISIILIIPLFKSPHYRVQRSRAIAATPEALFSWFNSHKKFNEFNPWMKMDPNAKVSYDGPENGVGAVSSWEGELTGTGSATIVESKPNEFIKLRMDWIKPLAGVSTVEYTLKPEGDKTVATWAMYGENNYVGKLISLAMDCEKMCGPSFEQGLADLEKLIVTK